MTKLPRGRVGKSPAGDFRRPNHRWWNSWRSWEFLDLEFAKSTTFTTTDTLHNYSVLIQIWVVVHICNHVDSRLMPCLSSNDHRPSEYCCYQVRSLCHGPLLRPPHAASPPFVRRNWNPDAEQILGEA